jgi:hypothetical protein
LFTPNVLPGVTLTTPVIEGDSMFISPLSVKAGPTITYDARLNNSSLSAGAVLNFNATNSANVDKTMAVINPGCAVCTAGAETGDIDLGVLYGATGTVQVLALRAAANPVLGPDFDNTWTLGLGGYAWSNVYSHAINIVDPTNPSLVINATTANQQGYILFDNNSVAEFQFGFAYAGGLNDLLIHDFGSGTNIFTASSNGDTNFTPVLNFVVAPTAGHNMQLTTPLVVESTLAIPAGGAQGAGLSFSATAYFGVFFGSGAPTLSAAQGSLYLRSDGSSTSTRLYVNTNGATTWTNVTTGS